MITLAQLRTSIANDLARHHIQDWSDGIIDQWIVDGLRAIAPALPCTASQGIDLTANATNYDLPSLIAQALEAAAAEEEIETPTTDRVTMLGITRVIHVAADNTETTLYRLSEDDLNFGSPCYDLFPAALGFILKLGWEPGANEHLVITYTTTYIEPAAGTDEIMLPHYAFEALTRYVIWQAWLYHANDPLPGSPEALAQQTGARYTSPVTLAERAYRAELKRIAGNAHANPPGAPRHADRFRGNRWA